MPDSHATTDAPAAAHDQFLDAGPLGCGDLVLVLKRTLDAMAAGAVLKLRAEDPGAAADIPAWCGMTRHQLLRADVPMQCYWIKRRAG